MNSRTTNSRIGPPSTTLPRRSGATGQRRSSASAVEPRRTKVRPGVAHRTFQSDRTGQPRHPPADGIQRHDLVGDVPEALLHQLDRRGALALVGPAAHDDDAVGAGDRCGVGQQRGASPEHRDRRDRREHVGHRVGQRPRSLNSWPSWVMTNPSSSQTSKRWTGASPERGMGGQQRCERFGHPLVVAGDLERLTDGVEAPHGDRIARRRARRRPRPEEALRPPRCRPGRRRRRRTGADRRRPSPVARRTRRPARRRRRRTPRTACR